MAEEQHHTSHDSENAGGEIKDRGIFDFFTKKKEAEAKPQEEVVAAEFEKVHVSDSYEKKEDEKEEKPCLKEEKPCPAEKLHRSNSSSSSSSSDEEEGEGGEKKKKKKGLKEKLLGEKKEEEKQKGLKEKILGEKKEEEKKGGLKEKILGEKKEEEKKVVETEEEKKGFLEKIKEKLPGAQPKKAEDSHDSTATVATEFSGDPHGQHAGEEAKERKGLLEKIKEKLPGYHKTEEKEETAHH